MNRIIQGLLIAGLALISLTTLAQSTRLRSANKQFDDLSYVNAVKAYEEFLKTDKKKEPAEMREAMIKLGYSYRKLQDTRNAERVFGDLIKTYPDLDSEVYLYYAQSLAANGKYRESQKQYSLYGEKQSQDMRGRRFTVSYMDMSRFYQDSSSFRVQSLPINSQQADFSPMYYKNGLVFVSARDESGVVKRVFNWNQTPFLDLYFHPDTFQLRAPGAEAPVRPSPAVLGGGAPVLTETATSATQPLTKAEIFSRTLNTKYHEGPMTFTKDQNTIVFTRTNSSKGKTGKSANGIKKLKLYTSMNKDGKWTDIQELPFNNSEYSMGHPAFSPDNTKMYFVSDMPGGYGGTDIYVVEYNNGQWGTPVNMGKEINTEGNEMFPFADEGGLYFSSDGHEGLGGLDVFFAELKEGVAYKGVQNMGAPINSEKDDFGFITESTHTSGYFSSNRKKGAASDDDIYSFRRACKQLNIFVYDAKTGTPLENADVRILRNGANQDLRLTNVSGKADLCVDANTEYEFKAIKEGFAMNTIRFSTLTQSLKPVMNVSIYLERTENALVKGVVKTEVNQMPATGVKVTRRKEKFKTEQTIITGPDGGYEFNTKPNTSYTITAQKDRYAIKKAQFTKAKRTKKAIPDSLGLYGVGDVFQLKNIYYDLNKFFIRADAARELDHVVKLLKEYPKMQIELRSHTDARSSDLYNIRLSENRARAAMDYLVSRGISPARLLAHGYGETELVNNCDDGINCTEPEHQKNRRTEFKILAVK